MMRPAKISSCTLLGKPHYNRRRSDTLHPPPTSPYLPHSQPARRRRVTNLERHRLIIVQPPVYRPAALPVSRVYREIEREVPRVIRVRLPELEPRLLEPARRSHKHRPS